MTGTEGANLLARETDLVIGIGTRYSDFTSASKTAFTRAGVRFININVAEFDAYKHSALPLVGDARVTLEELALELSGYAVADDYRARVAAYNQAWDAEVHRIYNLEHEPLLSQGEVIGLVNSLSAPGDTVLCAAGSLPGDLHKLWRTRDRKGYHLEYGYSTMGYEIAGGMGVKLADPEREVWVMVGDGSFLMMHTEIVTMVQEGIKVNIIVLDNHGHASIGGLSKSVGSDGFGTKYRYRSDSGQLDGDTLPIDFAAELREPGRACHPRGRPRSLLPRHGRGESAHGRSRLHRHRGRPAPARARLRILVGCAGGGSLRERVRPRSPRRLRSVQGKGKLLSIDVRGKSGRPLSTKRIL